MRVPYGLSVHDDHEIGAVTDVLRGSTQMGARTAAFEAAIASLFGKPHGIMVNSGSSALLLAPQVLNLQSGDEVITPVLTFATTVSSLLHNNLRPVFIDVTLAGYVIDIEAVERAITPRTKAMVIPDLLGNLPDWQHLRTIADRYDLYLIEDSADTLGASFSGRSTGSYADVCITSFYGSHVINCAGNGGMLCVSTKAQADRAKLLRSWGRSSSLFADSEAIENRFNVMLDGIPYDAKFVFEAIGYNFEPSEIGAAFGLVQLQRLADNTKIRKQNFARLTAFIKHYADFFIPADVLPQSDTAWLAFPLLLTDHAPFTRRDLQIFLEQRNIQTRVIFTGNILRQPAFANIDCVRNPAGYPHADYVMRNGMLIGCHHGLTEAMLTYLEDSLQQFCERFSTSPSA